MLCIEIMDIHLCLKTLWEKTDGASAKGRWSGVTHAGSIATSTAIGYVPGEQTWTLLITCVTVRDRTDSTELEVATPHVNTHRVGNTQ